MLGSTGLRPGVDCLMVVPSLPDGFGVWGFSNLALKEETGFWQWSDMAGTTQIASIRTMEAVSGPWSPSLSMIVLHGQRSANQPTANFRIKAHINDLTCPV